MKLIALACGITILALVAVVYGIWRASLPQLDGEIAAQSLQAPLSIERDALGIPTIQAANRADLAFGTGFVHGQDRFFQMDLSRRLAAGELTELFGAVAAEQDAKTRLFKFRDVARRVLEQATPQQRALIAAYVRGVNAGLDSLSSRPWEYWVLRSRPVPWREEDTILVVHAMWLDLQSRGASREMLRRQIDSRLGGSPTRWGWKRATCFLYPNRSDWDAPNGEVSAEAPADFASCAAIPTPAELNIRAHRNASTAVLYRGTMGPFADAGSNNWAVAGSQSASGGALIANDMHLSLRVPTTWYRARLKTGTLDLNGVTLPGAPVLVAGSNGFIAWGFTNSYGDWLDLEQRACDSKGSGVRFRKAPAPGQCWFVHWLATVPEATNMRLLEFEQAHSVAEGLVLAPLLGIPHQNLVIGDRAGHIAWTIAGRIPRAHGPSRNDGTSGWLTYEEQPHLVDPPTGRIWTANARPTDDLQQQLAIGDNEAILGADFDLGARARQIRDDLFAILHPATPADMLAIQLDDRARFLARWHDFLLRLLDEGALREQPRRVEFKRSIENWQGRASVDSVSYRLVREYRDRTESAVWRSILLALDITEDAPAPAQFEQPLWTLMTAQPIHFLPAQYGSWREFLLAQVDATIAASEAACGRLADCRWGRRNPVHVHHPLSRALPFLAPLLDMPAVELPGDHDMPRVQDGTSFGASERFAVTPGREGQGYLQIAGGQSGHPLSPYYRAGFKEWAEGKPLPFLPGPAAHRLVLRPR